MLQDYADFDKLEVTDPYKNPVLAPILESAKRLKERFPDVSMTTSVAGLISTAIAVRPIEVMKDGSIDDVIEACKDCLRKCGDNPKGYIFEYRMSAPDWHTERNVEAFIYAARKYGRGAQLGKLPKGILED